MGPAKSARISALMNRMDANVIPPSNTIAIYEKKRENDIKTPNKSFGNDLMSIHPYEKGHGYASNYQSKVKTTALKSKINVTPDADATTSTSKYQVKDSGYSSYVADSDYVSSVVKPPVPMSKISVRTQEPSITSPYQAKRSGYGSYETVSENASSVVRSPVSTSKIHVSTPPTFTKSSRSTYQMNPERLTPLNEINRRKSDETPGNDCKMFILIE